MHARRYALCRDAKRMSAASETTATVQLIPRLGWENVETALPLVGHGAPGLNLPLLITQIGFALGATAVATRIDSYLDSSNDEPRCRPGTKVAPVLVAPGGRGERRGPTRIVPEYFTATNDVRPRLDFPGDSRRTGALTAHRHPRTDA